MNKVISEASRESGIPATTLATRMKRYGITLEEAILRGRANRPPERNNPEDDYFVDCLRAFIGKRGGIYDR